MRNEKILTAARFMHTVNDELLSRRDVAALFKVHQATVIRWEQAGQLKAFRIGLRSIRYRASEVRELLIACASKAPALVGQAEQIIKQVLA